MTTIVLAHGDPWLITNAHCMTPSSCPQSSTPANCPTGTQLWQCQRYTTPSLLLYQPASPGALAANVVGWTQRYVIQGGTAQSPVIDVAAAALDDNTVDRDRSLATHFNKSAEMDKLLEAYGFVWGQHSLPPLQSQVYVVAGNPGGQGVDIKNAHTFMYGQPEHYTLGACPQTPQTYVTNQIELTMDTPSDYIVGGDSGSPIIDSSGYIIGMLSAAGAGGSFAVGIPIADVQNALGYDSIYGQNATDLAVTVHPSFRTVVQGQGACAWAYIKNTGTFIAQNVAIQNVTTFSPQPSFDYLNPAGAWNTPYSIPAGQTAQFAVCMTLNQPQIPINWIPNFYGTNAAAPVIKAAYNTFATRWTSTPLPDPIVWTATLSNDDVVHTNGPNGTGLFTVTTWNNGATGNVTITLDTDWGYGGLPYTLWVCETDAQSQCFATPSPSLSLQMTAGSTHYFAVLPQGQGQPVTLDPYYHRVFFRIREGFNQPTGTLVGGAGLSITTN